MQSDNATKIRQNIERNLSHVRRQIEDACKASNRPVEEVQLMLVTKTVPLESIRYAIEAGENLLGENTSQELEKTHVGLHKTHNPSIHFIGYLEEKYIDQVLDHADCIQSVDRLALAQKLDARLQEQKRTMDILIQVNTSMRKSHFGVPPEHAIGLVYKVAKLKHLRIKGLMTIGLFEGSETEVRACFQLLKNLYDEINFLKIPGVNIDILSMGMSDALGIAIEEGSTMVRVGTAVFGERIFPDSYYWNEK